MAAGTRRRVGVRSPYSNFNRTAGEDTAQLEQRFAQMYAVLVEPQLPYGALMPPGTLLQDRDGLLTVPLSSK
jgi:hypothetical protein